MDHVEGRAAERAYAHAVIILTLHATNTANITSVANINTFSKEANFITALRFLTPKRPYLIPRDGRQRVESFAIPASPAALSPAHHDEREHGQRSQDQNGFEGSEFHNALRFLPRTRV
jgi:hypothetical protein